MQQVTNEVFRAATRHFESHAVTITARGQLAFQRALEIINFLVVDKQIAVPGHPELVTAEHIHARKEFAHELMNDRGQKHEVVRPGLGHVR